MWHMVDMKKISKLFVLKYTKKIFFFLKKTTLAWGSVRQSYPEK